MTPSPSIRPTVRAVIRKGRFVLVQVKAWPTGQRYLTLPGGRQEVGETMADCLRRECLEEIGTPPDPGEILHVADVVRSNPRKTRQLSEVLFHATIPDDYIPRLGPRPDKRQVATVWADPAIDGAQFQPRYDLALCSGNAPIYLGRLCYETP